ncbi:MAG: dihydropteroate synthase [Candidatus Azobacteroides sp.]|nr:dihydropteroate synthase [Candidatus Azobacteroides sp.]
MTANIKGELMDLDSPKVMGILNITPDSFYAGSRRQSEKDIACRTVQILEEGGDIIDVGAYSSRPQAAYVSEEEEIERLRFGLEILFREAPQAVVSIDTFRANIARECVEKFGAAIINDISAGELDARMWDTAAELQVPYIAMHMRGTPQNSREQIQYENLMQDILLYFAEKVGKLNEKGVNDVWIDPGFGFSKTTDQNYEILSNLEQFAILERPLLVGFSRKTMIREVAGVSTENALTGTIALNMFALTKGACILRVHDVKEAVQTVSIFSKIIHSSLPEGSKNN